MAPVVATRVLANHPKQRVGDRRDRPAEEGDVPFAGGGETLPARRLLGSLIPASRLLQLISLKMLSCCLQPLFSSSGWICRFCHLGAQLLSACIHQHGGGLILLLSLETFVLVAAEPVTLSRLAR